MNIVRNVAAVLIGIIVGAFINILIVSYSGSIIPPPEGINLSDIDSLKNNVHLFKPIHFLMPFLAHAVGTFSGSLLASLVAYSHKRIIVLIIGCFFLLGGITMVFQIDTPIWFITVDLGLAYIPMSLLALFIGNTILSQNIATRR